MMVAALFGAIILLPLYLQGVRGLTPLTTGLSVLPGGLLIRLFGPVVGRIYNRSGPRVVLVPGTVQVSVALWLLTLVGEGISVWFALATHLILSLGFAALFTPLFTVALG